MSEQPEYRQILETARTLGRIPVSAADAQRAVAAVRESLAPQRRSRHRSWWIVSGSIAAAIVAAVVLIVNIQPASAAQKLRAAAEKTRAYRGWVHVTPVPRPKSGNTNAPAFMGLHINTADGTTAIEIEIFARACIWMSEPARKRELMYSALTNQLIIQSANPDAQATMMKHMAEFPLKLADVLADQEARGEPPPKVSERRDGELQRFELRDEKTLTVVWCDPQSKLIRKVQTDIDEQPTVLEYAYGRPEIRDIYDLGVPRTVAVIESRESPTTGAATRPRVFDEPDVSRLTKDDTTDLKELAARIQKRLAADFGDYVLIECQEFKDRRVSNRQGSIQLQARSGQRATRANYLVAPAAIFIGGPGFPSGWPTPKLEDVLKTVKSARPTSFSMYDGKTLWTISAPNAALETKIMPAPQALSRYELGRQFWTTQGLGQSFGEQKVELLRDANRPGLIVLHVKTTDSLPTKDAKEPRKIDAYYWIDSQRDDLPVEWIQRSNDYGGDKLDCLIHHVNLEFAQLADKRWYPSHWQLRTSNGPMPGVTDVGAYRDVHLQILENAPLPEEWFADPAKRLNATTMPTFPR